MLAVWRHFSGDIVAKLVVLWSDTERCRDVQSADQRCRDGAIQRGLIVCGGVLVMSPS